MVREALPRLPLVPLVIVLHDQPVLTQPYPLPHVDGEYVPKIRGELPPDIGAPELRALLAFFPADLIRDHGFTGFAFGAAGNLSRVCLSSMQASEMVACMLCLTPAMIHRSRLDAPRPAMPGRSAKWSGGR